MQALAITPSSKKVMSLENTVEIHTMWSIELNNSQQLVNKRRKINKKLFLKMLKRYNRSDSTWEGVRMNDDVKSSFIARFDRVTT